MKLGLVLGDMLFNEHSLDADAVFMAEDVGLCTHFKYHKHKLVLFLSAMRSHRDSLRESGVEVLYHELSDESFFDCLNRVVDSRGVSSLVTYEVSDKWFRKEIVSFAKNVGLSLEFVRNPSFLTSKDEWLSWRSGREELVMANFYSWQRKRLDILVDGGSPVGGKWSFDSENRKKLPDDFELPASPRAQRTKHTEDVVALVESRFSDHPGVAADFWLPTTPEDSLAWMDAFFSDRFMQFGDFQDALSSESPFLFHSVLSPMINCGLLLPGEVVDAAVNSEAPLNAREGFVRQVIGWREFVRWVYETEELEENFFGHSRKLSSVWWSGDSGFGPLDVVVDKVLAFGYAHHIERLMVVGNLMTLCRVAPREAYAWFMELFVDSADWVMVPNVYGMALFADGGVFATKPYVSSSNYIKKMSSFRGDWEVLWDGLYWSFIADNRSFFADNPRMRMMVSLLDKMSSEKLAEHRKNAQKAMDVLTE